MAAGVACGSCGTDLREKAKFCDECGAPTAVSGDTGKYKQVTVLFADVVRSMDIAAAVDIERFREIMTELVERSAAVVQRYGGTVEYTGDGVMALFGAPVALEDHAFRGCLAALAIQEETNRLAAQVARRDGVALWLRVGLNSGRVIAGEIGSGSLGYAATGEQVGMARRMESAAPPGGVMLSESTARLVEQLAILGGPERVHIKGADEPVPVRRLMAIQPRHALVGRTEASLVGRRWEMTALEAMVDRTVGGRGGVVNVVGPPGVGKSRVSREAAALAAARGVELFWAFCESHARDLPFAAVTRLLRAATGMADVEGDAARAQLRTFVPDADPQDLLLIDDLLGVADPDVPLPQIDPDARRRRLTALINTASLARTEPALFVIEDAHWIDAVSESMLADFLTVVARTPSMVLITSRPEYRGALTRVPGAQTISLAPLGDSDTAALLGELLGSDSSVSILAATIADRAAGNPFFAEEMVRELVQRGVLTGERGNHVCRTDVTEMRVPATVEAAIEARIDRLSTPAKQTLYAASVIGARFDAELLTALGLNPVFDELIGVELIDQARFTPGAEYAFHHPLIRAVAYESQLKSDRATWHRRLATAIQERSPESVEENAALIAGHLEAAGELTAAYGWHIRAAAWSVNRDINAARISWEQARRISDALPDDDPGQLSMRIAPRTMLCTTAWQAINEGNGQFAELRELCGLAGDKLSLAIGMSGYAAELLYSGHAHEEPQLPAEQMTLLESADDPAPLIGTALVPFNLFWDTGQFGELLRWVDIVIDRTGGDPAIGAAFGMASPLAGALAWRSVARGWLGRPGWRQDIDDATAMARNNGDPSILALVATWAYGLTITHGMLRADDDEVRAVERAVQAAEESSDAIAAVVTFALGMTLLSRDAAADRDRGMEVMMRARDMLLKVPMPFLVPVADLWTARESARRGERDAAIPIMRTVVGDLHKDRRPFFGVWGAGVLVETLLERGAQCDLGEAQRLIGRLATFATEDGSAMLDITRLRLRALLARARGDDVAHRDLVIRYRAMAESLGYEGHIDWAEAMT